MTSPNSPETLSRLNYIDHLRSFAMLLGILVHTTTLADFGNLELASTFSDFFRMATFFLVSGFFACLLLQKRNTPTFYRQRLTNVLVPLISTLLLVNPVTLLLIFKYHNADSVTGLGIGQAMTAAFGDSSDVAGPLVWHLHLWFLFSLAFFVVMAVPINRLLQNQRLNRALDKARDALPSYLVPVSIALLVAVLVVLMRVAYEVMEIAIGDVWLVKITLSYWPFYLVGMALCSRRTDWEMIHRIDPFTFLLSLAAFGLYLQLEALSESDNLTETVRIFAHTLARCGLIYLLLFFFRALMDRQTPIGSALADAIYSVYIFHFLFIYLIATYLIDARSAGPLAFFAVAVLTAAATFALHRWVIRPVPALRFLFNGRASS